QSDLSVPMDAVLILAKAGAAPWNNLKVRSIPLFKDYGLKKFADQPIRKDGVLADTLIFKLPYNAQVTPYLKIKSPLSGIKITLFTDNYLIYNGGDNYLRSEYITRKGIQEYESLG